MKSKLINYLFEKQIPGRSFNVYLYNGKLVHTIGSMEYRDQYHEYIDRFEFFHENYPYSKSAIKRMVEYRNQKN